MRILADRRDKERLLLLLQERERRRCAKDCQRFVERHVRIEDRDHADIAIPFTLWPGQVEALQAFISQRLVIVLKARQLGLTWLALSYALWRCIFQPGYSVVLLSQKEDDAKELVRRLTFILRHLPPWMTQEKGETFAGPAWSATVLTATIEHPNGEPSTFKAMASAPGAGRSFTASLVILDEWAFQEHAREIWSAAFPTINRPTGGQVLGLSTAARGTLFEEIWDSAERFGFARVFLPWTADPRRTQEWYERTKLALAAAGESYHAEYPATAAEAFMYSAASVFSVERVMTRLEQVKDLTFKCGNITWQADHRGDPLKGTQKFVEDPNGWLTVFEEPKPGYPYVIGGDTAEGGHDWSVGQVIDNTTGRQVARWRAHCDTDVYAKQMAALGWWYNDALIAIETNFDLHPVKELDRLGYWNQFKREVIDEISHKTQHKHGWRTTPATRPPLIDNLVEVVREEPELISDVTTLEEMLTFVRNEDGKPEAQEGKHDDCVMSLAIAHKAREQMRTTVADAKKKLPRSAPRVVVDPWAGY